MILCNAGVFIGVDNYSELSGTHSLISATASACKIASYFQKATPDGNWASLVDRGEQLLTRSEILEKLTEWIPTVEKGKAGILYLAGHGVTTEAGWIFCPRDFRPKIAFDSGIPIDRIFTLITKLGQKEGAYILILDSCRTGDDTKRTENIPSNTFVIYACTEGRVALETEQSSIFVDSFLIALETMERVPVGKFRYARLSALCATLKQGTAKIAGNSLQQCDFRGSSEDIFIPLYGAAVSLNLKAAPIIQMETRILQKEQFDEVRQNLRVCLYAVGLPSQYVDSSVLEEAISEDSWKITFSLPPFSALYLPSALLDAVLSRCQSAFERLSLKWPTSIGDHRFKKLARAKACRYDWLVSTHASTITWQNKTCLGQVLIQQTDTTFVLITCQSDELSLMTLDWLTPSLAGVYNSLCNLHNDS